MYNNIAFEFDDQMKGTSDIQTEKRQEKKPCFVHTHKCLSKLINI